MPGLRIARRREIYISHLYICVRRWAYTSLPIHRERERERDMYIYIYMYTCICMHRYQRDEEDLVESSSIQILGIQGTYGRNQSYGFG